MRSVLLEAARMAFRALVLAPLIGGALGSVAAYASFNLASHGGYDFAFAGGEGFGFGVLSGLAFGVVVTWPLRHERLWQVALYLCSGTICGAVVGIISPGTCWFGGMIGFWFGFALLMARRGSEASARLDGHEEPQDCL